MFSANSSQVSDDKLFVEDVFSTHLYTGTGSAQTITNGIDLAGKGGLVIQKERSSAYADGWFWGDTVRGANTILKSQNANGQTTSANTISAFSSTGFTAGSNISFSGSTYASWTFREAPKFFDVVTWTGTGADRSIAHNLGIAPGLIIIKRTNSTGDWWTYHRSIPNFSLKLNSDGAQVNQGGLDATSTTFTLYDNANVNASGGTYVAYVYAHDTASDGIIQCGAAAAGTDINLGWEPQFVIIKKYDGVQTWIMNDNMRGMSVGGNTAADLYPNAADAEVSGSNNIFISATGFKINLTGNLIYMAIRRGPMRTPTLGTSVFAPVLYTGTSTAGTISGASFPPDLVIPETRNNANNRAWFDRLRGRLAIIQTDNANAEIAAPSGSNTSISSFNMNGISVGTDVYATINQSGYTYVNYFLGRAPGFFDEVCFTQASGTQNHNLGVAPELVILKSRSTADSWYVFAAQNGFGQINSTAAWGGLGNGSGLGVNLANVTSTTLSKFSNFGTGNTAVAYMFATLAGVSKVGTYTGNGSSQTINCGFAAGARFVLIKRTDTAGDWYVWDTARGIVAGNDRYIALNLADAEVTTNDTIDTDSTGFVVNQVAATNVNVSSATYIYLAIA